MGSKFEDMETKFSSSTWSSDDESISSDESSANHFKYTTDTMKKFKWIAEPELQRYTSTKGKNIESPFVADSSLREGFITEAREVVSNWDHDTTKLVLQHRDDSTNERKTQSEDSDDDKYEELEMLISKKASCGDTWFFTKKISEGDFRSRVSCGPENFSSSSEESFDNSSTTDEYSDSPADYDTDDGYDNESTDSTNYSHRTGNSNTSLSTGTYVTRFPEEVSNCKKDDRDIRSKKTYAVKNSANWNIGDVENSEFKQFEAQSYSFESLEYLKKTDPLTAMIVADLQSVQESMDSSTQNNPSSSISTNRLCSTKQVHSGMNRSIEVSSVSGENVEDKKVVPNDMRDDSSRNGSLIDSLTCVNSKTVSNKSKTSNLSDVSSNKCMSTNELNSSFSVGDKVVYSVETSLLDEDTPSFSDDNSRSSSRPIDRYLPELEKGKLLEDPPGDQLDVIGIHNESDEEDKDVKKKKKSFISRAIPFIIKRKRKGKKKGTVNSKSDFVITDEESIIHETGMDKSNNGSATTTPTRYNVLLNLDAFDSEEDPSVSSLQSSEDYFGVDYLSKKNMKKQRSLHVMARVPLSDNSGNVPDVHDGVPSKNSNIGMSPNPLEKTLKVYETQSEKQVASVYAKFDHDPGVLEVRTYQCLPKIKPGSDDVIIKVEASTISKMDCNFRSSKCETKKNSLPITPGIDVVGRVYKTHENREQCLIGQRVASLIYSGGNARYAVIPESRLVPVPETVEASDAVCLVETYLKAFQTLQMGQPKKYRYVLDSLQGKSILVIDGISNFGQAVIELAVLSGGYAIYTTALEKHHEFLKCAGAIPLDMAPDCWLPEIKGKMDIVIDSCCIDNYVSSWKATNSNGKLVCVGMSALENESSDWITYLEASVTRITSKMMSRTSHYDLFESWENDFDCCKRDLEHLFSILASGLIKPHVANTFPLTKVARAQKMVESHNRIQGILVCEPWLLKKEKTLLI